MDEYQAEDRSILLPYYRRWAVEPLIALLPETLSPNAITHVGHLFNLSALMLLLITWPARGVWLAVAAVGVQLYIWCDNADGAHARRTGQTSAFGELLDHGLDVLNVAYIACIMAIGLGLGPTAWVLIVALVTGATAFAFWEQTETGVFHLGRLNQIESGLVLSITLCVSAALSTDFWAQHGLTIGGHLVTARAALVAFVVATTIVGMFGAVARVRRRAPGRPLAPIVVFATYDVAAFGLYASGFVTARVAVTLVLAGNVFFAVRMLIHRMCKDATYPRLGHPRFERTLVAAFGGLGFATVVKLGLMRLGPDTWASAVVPHVDTALAAAAVVWFAIGVARDTTRGIAWLREI